MNVKLNIGLVMLMISVGGCKAPSPKTDLQSLVERERVFAQRCSEVGIRASFTEFFADDGVAFRPGPVKYKEWVKGLPPQEKPMQYGLEWEPQTGGIAASGELGYTTGPSVFTDKSAEGAPKRFGQFFSVWKKQVDGAWKVAVDMGVSTTDAVFGTPFKASPRSTTSKTRDNRHEVVAEIEQEFSRSCTTQGILDAYLSHGDENTLLLRTDNPPIVGPASIRSYLKQQSHLSSWLSTGSDISKSGDLCYSFGTYQLAKDADPTGERGHYMRVWARNGDGQWKIVADITNPLRPEQE